MDCLAEIITPLEEGKLLFSKMSANEGLSRMFTYEVDLLSTDKSIAFADLLGKPMTVKLQLPEGDIRFFNGYVARFGFVGRRGAYYQYRATLKPWLWFLTRTQDCRIFQTQTAVDIIKAVFRDHTTAKYFAEDLIDTYPIRDYCVQYRETDFNFISRLLEQEGISYYFKHQENQHTLVLVDSNSYTYVPGYQHIPYIGQTENVREDKETIRSWFLGAEIQTGQYVLNDYDFERSKVGLEEHQDKLYSDIEHDDYEVYDYPGGYTDSEAAKHYVKARIEQIQSAFLQANGKTDARGLTTGYSFELTDFPREEQNGEYLVVNTHISIVQAYRDAHAISEGSHFECNFEVAHASNTWRPARLTPKPIVQGPQTAVVVGKKAEKKEGESKEADQNPDAGDDEIHTDKYGRVKVLFHWDREHHRLGSPENSSCWIRVSQPWAGKNFGFMAIPRVGQEVVVDFLEGDPDRPIITGRVYNDDQMPPWDLPEHMTRTGIVTRSTKGGNVNTANELRFDDKKGQELVYLHAEHNLSTSVEHDETTLVMHDSTEDIRHDRTGIVKHKDTLIVKEDGQVLVIEAGGQYENITGDRSFTLIGTEINEVSEARSTKIHKGDFRQADKEVFIIDKNAEHFYGGVLTTLVGENADTLVSGTVTHQAGGAHKFSAPSFDFTAVGSVNYQCKDFTRTCVSDKTNVLGPTTRMRIGSTFATAVGGANETMFGARNTLTVGAQMRTDVGLTMVARVGLELYQVLGAVVNIKQGTTVNLFGLSTVTNCPVNAEFSVLKTICGGSAAAVAKTGVAAGGRAAQAIAAGGRFRNAVMWFLQTVPPALTEGVAINKLYEAGRDVDDYRNTNSSRKLDGSSPVTNAQAQSYSHPETLGPDVSFDTVLDAFLGNDESDRFNKSKLDPNTTAAQINEHAEQIRKELEKKRDNIEPPPEPAGGWAKKPPMAEPPATAKEPPPEDSKEYKDYKLSQQEGSAGKPGDKPPEIQWPTEQDQWPKQQDNGGNSPDEDPNSNTPS